MWWLVMVILTRVYVGGVNNFAAGPLYGFTILLFYKETCGDVRSIGTLVFEVIESRSNFERGTTTVDVLAGLGNHGFILFSRILLRILTETYFPFPFNLCCWRSIKWVYPICSVIALIRTIIHKNSCFESLSEELPHYSFKASKPERRKGWAASYNKIYLPL